MNNNALLITQYEKYGSVGMNEYIENFINEMTVTIDMLSSFNDFLSNNHDDIILDMSFLEEYISTLTPSAAFSLAYENNDFNWNDDFYTFDGYGRLISYTENSVVRLMQENTDFLKWYIEENNLIDEEEAIQDIADANELIKQGY